MRSLVVLLLITVFFLAGLVVGIDRGQIDSEEIPATIETEEITDTEENQGAPLAQEQMVDEHLVDAGASSAHFTQKAAASMEAIVTRFYDLVVQILYQIAQLFFK
ncbi:MAG TPA: hypothetical protein VK136_03225 [Bacillota bacterium]|nr:hypothetical protein [Bacillota bacterium]